VSGHDKTLTEVFDEPTRSDITYDAAIALIKAHGGTVKEGAGSRVSITIQGAVIKIHRPHKKDLRKYAVESIRETFRKLGITPNS